MKILKLFFKGSKKVLEEFNQIIVKVSNSILLFVVYSVGAGLTSILARLVGKHFLDIKALKGVDSYWSDLNLKKSQFQSPQISR